MIKDRNQNKLDKITSKRKISKEHSNNEIGMQTIAIGIYKIDRNKSGFRHPLLYPQRAHVCYFSMGIRKIL